ncbi:transporter [Aquimarina sp. 2201CG1-2-11]|uniref:transporter n=1 Tax=Aquimarina discodermiae TaxID=3231043 RepID=UPI003461F3AD
MSHKSKTALLGAVMVVFVFLTTSAQTPLNGFFNKQNDLTIAVSYASKSFENFYRGKELTPGNPAGMGKISSNIYSLYAEYCVSDWLSTTATLPYITLENENNVPDPVHQESEINSLQDLSLFVKARAFKKQFENNAEFTFGGTLGTSVPVGGYEERGILSIGNGAIAVDGGAIAQYKTASNLFLELQALYSFRNNINPDHDLDVPNALLYSAKLGYYNKWFYAHAKIGIQNSLSGYDIGTPEFVDGGGPAGLPQTEVDYATAFFDVYVPFHKSFGISGGYAVNMTGRNQNRDSGFSVGVVYKAN